MLSVESPARAEEIAGKSDRADDGRPGADEFLDAFDAFVQAVRRARGVQTRDRERALTLSQYGLLQPLAESDGARVRELAAQAGIAPSTATRILDALERRGIVHRGPSAGDRRGVSVTLTASGREVLRAEDDWLRAREREFYSRLPDDERQLAPALLLRLASLIDEMAAGPVGDGALAAGTALPAESAR